MERALGTQWDVESDAFTFSTVLKPQPTTRRGILSVVSSVYDPLGFLALVVPSAKQILQELCKAKLGWDDKIPQEHADRWLRWLSQLMLLDEFSVSRCITPHGFGEISSTQLHHFCDARHDEDSGMISVDDPEVRNVVPVYAAVLQASESPTATLLSYFSSWIDLKRAVGWILKCKE
ncbi:hypothetical protein N1851_024334 [Merluccius polli]|uniref:Uncharacterized protein n=1 Tax=Merluccius polli TaxID=89951 RepID=A0AA47MF41_MERPO|nr:hypothetical protein N1851_024334 [Merluccius polli]